MLHISKNTSAARDSQVKEEKKPQMFLSMPFFTQDLQSNYQETI